MLCCQTAEVQAESLWRIRVKDIIPRCLQAGLWHTATDGCDSLHLLTILAWAQHYMLKTRFGFRDEDITMLTDDQNNPELWPTNANMRMHMQRLVAGAQPGDSLIFHYSGGFQIAACL